MKLTIAQKQFYIYIGLILLAVLLSFVSYRMTQQKWLLYRAAETQFHQQSFREAIPLYQSSLEKGITTPILYVHLADSYTTVGNFPEAITFYRKYLEIQPQDHEVRFLLARVLNWNGDLRESESEYRKVLEQSREK